MKNALHFLPFWEKLSPEDQIQLKQASHFESYKKGDLIHSTASACKGIMLILSGQVRIYLLSEEGRDVTLFRVHAEEVCVLSASCLFDSIAFDVFIEATEDTEVLVIQTCELNQVMRENASLELYLYKTITENFSDVMWTMQQILFMRIDQRIAQLLWDEMIHRNSTLLQITHDEIAKYIGSAREVVTKVMKYLAKEDVVALSRGKVEILDKEKLKKYL